MKGWGWGGTGDKRRFERLSRPIRKKYGNEGEGEMDQLWLVKFIYTVKNASEVHEKSSKQYR